ncbi:hypothetical protein [Nocardia farcinica]|uniref:hypothetical protein n=1 Tax=Nocardia farcinica TaxID=37329 RepID=UPI0012FEE882|nr:hypothetical protein [Nocardia farcinica]
MAAELDKLKAATKRYLKIMKRAEEARKEVYEAVVEALRAGESPADVAENSPYTQPYTRRIAREHGIEPATRGPKARPKHP